MSSTGSLVWLSDIFSADKINSDGGIDNASAMVLSVFIEKLVQPDSTNSTYCGDNPVASATCSYDKRSASRRSFMLLARNGINRSSAIGVAW